MEELFYYHHRIGGQKLKKTAIANRMWVLLSNRTLKLTFNESFSSWNTNHIFILKSVFLKINLFLIFLMCLVMHPPFWKTIIQPWKRFPKGRAFPAMWFVNFFFYKVSITWRKLQTLRLSWLRILSDIFKLM